MHWCCKVQRILRLLESAGWDILTVLGRFPTVSRSSFIQTTLVAVAQPRWARIDRERTDKTLQGIKLAGVHGGAIPPPKGMERLSSDRRDWLTIFRELMIRSGSHALGTTETLGLLARQLTKLFGTQLVDHGIQTLCSIATTDYRLRRDQILRPMGLNSATR